MEGFLLVKDEIAHVIQPALPGDPEDVWARGSEPGRRLHPPGGQAQAAQLRLRPRESPAVEQRRIILFQTEILWIRDILAYCRLLF